MKLTRSYRNRGKDGGCHMGAGCVRSNDPRAVHTHDRVSVKEKSKAREDSLCELKHFHPGSRWPHIAPRSSSVAFHLARSYQGGRLHSTHICP